MLADASEKSTAGFFDESTLVVLSPVAGPGFWMMQLAASCIAMFSLYLLCLHGNRTVDRPPVTTDDDHRQQVMRYLLTEHPQVTFVGTSLSHAFKSDYFSAGGYHRLTFPGGSALTGLEVISRSGNYPRVLIIETNILDANASTELINYFLPIWPPLEEPRRLVRDFKPIRTFLCQILHMDPGSDTMNKKPIPFGGRRAYYQQRKADLLSGNPVDHDITAAKNKVLSGHPTEAFLSAVASNAKTIVDIATRLEKQGVRVYLLSMPLPPDIANSWYSTAISKAIQKANAGRDDRWLQMDIDLSQLRWRDALHLDDRSNMLVIDALEKRLKEDSTQPAP